MKNPAILVKNRKELVQDMKDEYGYLFCQHCGQNQCGMKFETHHIVFRSEAPDHPNLHDKINLAILGSWCHTESPESFHKKKKVRNSLVLERGLDKIFGVCQL